MFRIITIILALALSSAAAQVPLTGAGGGIVCSGLVAANVCSSYDLNFAANPSADYSPFLTVTRASSGTNLLPSSASGFAYSTFGNNVLRLTSGLGLLAEESRTNQLLNSAVPVTQTTGSLANGTYTLWVNGSGSAQMSLGTATGCGIGTATQGSPVNFTLTGVAGTCIVTVVGLLNAFQLELGAIGTSLIVTAGATAQRQADNISLIGSALTLAQGSSGTFLASVGGVQNFLPAMIVNLNAHGVLAAQNSTQIRSLDVNNANSFLATVGGGTTTVPFKAFVSWDGTGRALGANNGTVATGTVLGGAVTSAGISLPTVQALDSYLARLTFWPFRSDAVFKALTQ